MARPELGTKRVCPTTGRKFYDLNKNPIVSPYTGQVVVVAAPLLRAATAAAAVAPRAANEDADEADLAAPADIELVALEEADEGEAASTATPVPAADDIEVEDDDTAADDTFLEEDEDEDDDVTDLIGEGIEEDEEP